MTCVNRAKSALDKNKKSKSKMLGAQKIGNPNWNKLNRYPKKETVMFSIPVIKIGIKSEISINQYLKSQSKP